MLKPAFSPRYLSPRKNANSELSNRTKALITRKWFFISAWKIAGMLPNKLKNLFNLDFQLNNCCIVMEAIYQNLKGPPPYLSIGERHGTMLIKWQNSDQICNILSFVSADWVIELRNLHIRLTGVRHLAISDSEPIHCNYCSALSRHIQN